MILNGYKSQQNSGIRGVRILMFILMFIAAPAFAGKTWIMKMRNSYLILWKNLPQIPPRQRGDSFGELKRMRGIADDKAF